MDTSILRLAHRTATGARHWPVHLTLAYPDTMGGLWVGFKRDNVRHVFALTPANRDNVKATVRDAFGLYAKEETK